MRFILGIIIGAALTLFAATAVDAPTNPLFDKVVNLWDAIIETTSEVLFENPTLSISPNTPPSTLLGTSPGPAREPTTPDKLNSPESPFAIAVDAFEVLAEKFPRSEPAAGEVAISAGSMPQAIADDEPTLGVAGASLERAPEVAASTRPAAETVAASAKAEASAQAEASAPVDLANHSANTIGQTNGHRESEPVWVSFHSQMSAEGFARQFSHQFQHPFTVARQGPGDYQVVFDYASIDERDALLDEIAAVTGYRAP